jgi:hypothetical protein
MGWYLRGIHGSARLRASLNAMTQAEDMLACLAGVEQECHN